MENTEVKEVIENDVKTQEQIDAELSEEIFIETMKAEEDAHNALVAERDDFKNKYLYTLAELDNTKKRFSTERPRIVTQAVSRVVNKVFTIIDDFERAIKTNANTEDVEILKNGYTVLYDKFISVLNSMGIKKIDTTDVEFNTDYHEAVVSVPGPEENKNKVIECIETGYTYNDTVIRHAKVAVGS